MDLKFLKLVPCKQTYEMHIQMHIQVHELAPPTCVLKILIDPLPLSYIFSPPLFFVVFSLSLYTLFLPYHSYLCFSPPLLTITTKGELKL